jgi:BirA family biotin operon repressor/biotin-[acetyl-CoA-carboxylase] ligase
MDTRTYLKLIKLGTIGSTNDYAYALARGGAREITIVRAESQTKGRGRFRRTWVSPSNKGIYASFILRPHSQPEDVYYLPLIFSLAAVKALENILPLKIKLPNDIIAGSKKIGGVLVEAKTTFQKVDFAVVGIGININAKAKDIPPTATSLYLETGIKYNIDILFRKLIKQALYFYREFKQGKLNILLREAFFYQETKNLKKLKDTILETSPTPINFL